MERAIHRFVAAIAALLVAAAIGYLVAGGQPARPAAPAPAACVDDTATRFNECAALDTTQVQDRRTDTTVTTRPADPVVPTFREAVVMVVAGDYLYPDGAGPITRADFAALQPVYRAAESGLHCVAMVRQLQDTGDFTGAMVPCLGEEDSPAVDVILRSVGK